MTAYYNEIDPYAAQWLRNLIDAGLIPHGDVDERSIVDVAPSDLAGYTQCHFFAGIAGWALAARLAGWPDDRELWTGSAPCQPFSVAGAQRGTDDERHLWPHFLRLIAARRPAVVFGEQVANAAGAKREKGSSLKRAIESLAREKPGTLESYRQIIADCQPGREHDRGCEEAREAERLGLRFGGLQRAVDDANQLGDVRADRDATQAVWRPEGLGYAIAGSDSAGAGLHDQQCSGDRVRPERDDADMGAGSRNVDHGCAEGQRSGTERELPREVRSGARASTTADWLDGVQSDLHALGYTCGAAIVPCCAVDAPHRRDRLWFVARAGAVDHGERARLEGHAGNDCAASGWAQPDRSAAATGRGSDVAHADSERAQVDTHAGWRTPGSGAREVAGPSGARDGDVADADREAGRSEAWQPFACGGSGEVGIGSLEPGRRGSSAWGGAGWIIGHDGKARRVGSDVRRVVDGLPRSLAGMCAGFYAEAAQGVIDYASATKCGPGEVLRTVRDIVAAEAVWQKPRGFYGVCEADILLPYLRELERRIDEGRLSGAVQEIAQAGVRGVRVSARSACPSQGRGLHEQRTGEYPDAMHALSRLLACAARQAIDPLLRDAEPMGLLAHGIEARVGKLRALGNAIVPAVAAEVIAAFMESTPAQGGLFA